MLSWPGAMTAQPQVPSSQAQLQAQSENTSQAKPQDHSSTEWPEAGLNTAQVQAIARKSGPNVLSVAKPRGWWHIARELLSEPMFALLLIAAVLYGLLGDVHESLSLLFMVGVVLALTLYQQGRTEHAVEALASLASPRAAVLRDGQLTSLPAAEVVPGDVLRIKEGDRVAADGVVIGSSLVSVDESLLSGESVPIERHAGQRLWAGTLVVQGVAWFKVQHTGAHTRMGQLGQSLQTISPGDSPLQQQTRVLVRRMAAVGLFLSVCLAALQVWRDGDLLAAALSGIALAMALLPQEFVVVLTVLPALGAWRLSHQKVLIRRMRALETLGAITVLCVDKTGTLTQNRMQVAAMDAAATNAAHHPDGVLQLAPNTTELPEATHALLEYAILASEALPVDPMERAFHELGQRCLRDTEHLHQDWTLVQRYELSPELRAMSRVWWNPPAPMHEVATKGAPEAVMDLCHLDAEALAHWREAVHNMARQGLRVLGVARAKHNGPPWPALAHDYAFEWVGLIGLLDPLREDVPAALAQCQSAGVRVVMITGDYPQTAQAIAVQAGLIRSGGVDQVLNGAEMDAMSDEVLRQHLQTKQVCARISPAQKLRIVQSLASLGEVVAMTGDGVNDAPALKAAHVGVALGEQGTDVAREAASVVLVDDRFASLVGGLRMGRRTDDNLRKAVAYIVAVHVPVAGMALLPVLLGWPQVLWPMHIVLLEILIDPACSLVFEQEAEAPDLMSRAPRDPQAALLEGRAFITAMLEGLGVLAMVMVVVLIARQWVPQDLANTWAFLALVIGDLVLVLVSRAVTGPARWVALTQPNPALAWVAGLTLITLTLGLTVPPLAELLHLVPVQRWF